MACHNDYHVPPLRNLLYQNRKGSLENEMWLSYDRTMTSYLAYQPWVEWCKANSYLFSSYLQQLVGDKIKDIQSGF